MITVYGLRNCDTCKEALRWLYARDEEHRFHDVRADGLDARTVGTWVRAVGWEKLLNTRGTTWRGLPDADKEGVDEKKAITLMVAHPALVKRPVFDHGEGLIVGFGKTEQAALEEALER